MWAEASTASTAASSAGLAGSRVLGHHQGDGFRRVRCRVAILAGALRRIGGFALGIRFRILCRAGFGLGGDDGLVALRPALRGTAAAAAAAAALLFLLLLALGFGLGLEQSLTVGDRDLIVIGMDFAEGEEPVAVSAVFHEGRLERRFDPGDLREIDIPAQLLPVSGFEVEFFDLLTTHHHDPGFFRV